MDPVIRNIVEGFVDIVINQKRSIESLQSQVRKNETQTAKQQDLIQDTSQKVKDCEDREKNIKKKFEFVSKTSEKLKQELEQTKTLNRDIGDQNKRLQELLKSREQEFRSAQKTFRDQIAILQERVNKDEEEREVILRQLQSITLQPVSETKRTIREEYIILTMHQNYVELFNAIPDATDALLRFFG